MKYRVHTYTVANVIESERPSMLANAAKTAALIGLELRQAMDLFSAHLILTTLAAKDYNQFHTARALGIHRNTLSRQLSELEARGVIVSVHEAPRKMLQRIAATQYKGETTA